jgi:hypothetical protein
MRSRLNLIERAISKVNDGIYGQCSNCGDDINPKRLEAIPFILRHLPGIYRKAEVKHGETLHSTADCEFRVGAAVAGLPILPWCSRMILISTSSNDDIDAFASSSLT